jgi:hypothetical protein
VVVLEEDQTVAGGVVGAGDGDDLAAELASSQALIADASVEAGDIVVAVSEDELAACRGGGAIGRVLLSSSARAALRVSATCRRPACW